MTGDQALQELLDVSEDIFAAVIFDGEGNPVAATVSDEEAQSAAETASAMLAYANALRSDASVTRLEATAAEGSVFVVSQETGAIVAATGRDAVTGLVYHDLRATLRKLGTRTRKQANAAS
jgi:predicted regulator of Ras-like GTPase activity (Roadblock/LC7/MglB family)